MVLCTACVSSVACLIVTIVVGLRKFWRIIVSIMKMKIKSWLSAHAHWLVFWLGTLVLGFSLVLAPFSRRSISAEAATSVESGSYYFSGFPGIHGYSDLGDVPVDVELEFGLWTPFACSESGSFASWLPYGFVYTETSISSSDYTFYNDGGTVAVASPDPSLKASRASGFYRYSASIYTSAFGSSYSWRGATHYLTAYPQSAAVASSMTSLSSSPMSSPSFPCYVMASPRLILDSSFTVGHSYTFQIDVCLGDDFSDSESLFAGRDMVWNGSYFASTSPLTWYRPSFIPDSLSSSSSSPLSVVVTPTSFFDSTDGKYIYPFKELKPSVPIPPDPPGPGGGGGSETGDYQDGYDAGYVDGYDAGQRAGYDSGYNSGYSDGYNKGQSEQMTNPAISFLLPVQSFLNTDLFGSFSFGDAFSVVMFVLVAVIFIKLFAGG